MVFGTWPDGKMIEDLSHHKSTKFTREERDVDEALRSPFFNNLQEIGVAYEIERFKQTVFQLAKLGLLEFYYDFLGRYFSRKDFELRYMDTDSHYLAMSGDSLDDIVRPEMKHAYVAGRKNWLVTDEFSKRTPCLFIWHAVPEKSSNFFSPKMFFWCNIILFLSTWLCYINFFFDDMKYFFVQHQHVFVETKLLFVERQIFFQHKVIFCATPNFVLNVMSWCMFLLSHSNKNIITSQKINKLSFLYDTKKTDFTFCAPPFFYIQFLHYTLSACWSPL